MGRKMRLLEEYKGQKAGTLYLAENNEAHEMIEKGIASLIVEGFFDGNDKMMRPGRKKQIKTK